MTADDFRGVFIPLITPFHDGRVNTPVLEKLAVDLLNDGVAGLVPCGTTGESPVLSEDDRREVIETCVQVVGDRGLVIAGTGSNNTETAVRHSREAQEAGANALLVVAPYYNRPNQEGLYAHFKAVAESTDLPIILYNIPKRTGVNIDADTIARLAKLPNIAGVKEASGDPNMVMDVIARTNDFAVLAGDDHMVYPTLALGGVGTIAASAHIAAPEWVRLVRLCEDGHWDEARALHYRLLPLARVLFTEPSPAPLKAALEMLGYAVGEPKLPLVPASGACRARLRTVLAELGLAVAAA